MRKIIFCLVFVMCSSTTSSIYEDVPLEDFEAVPLETNIVFENEYGDLVSEDLTNKKTLVIFWADYWGICREELPLLENKLEELSETYDVLALAHSDPIPTMEWVSNNLNGNLQIGFSTKALRDSLQVVGQPITIIFDTNGEILSREFGYIP